MLDVRGRYPSPSPLIYKIVLKNSTLFTINWFWETTQIMSTKQFIFTGKGCKSQAMDTVKFYLILQQMMRTRIKAPHQNVLNMKFKEVQSRRLPREDST